MADSAESPGKPAYGILIDFPHTLPSTEAVYGGSGSNSNSNAGFIASVHVVWRWMMILCVLNGLVLIVCYAVYAVRAQILRKHFPGRKAPKDLATRAATASATVIETSFAFTGPAAHPMMRQRRRSASGL